MQAEILATLLVGCIALMLVLGLLIKDKDFSENENRGLAQFPKISFGAVWDGSILSDFSDYVADQFPGRDLWMTLNLKMNQLLGQKEVSGVYLCEEDYLMQVPSTPNDKQVSRNLEAVNTFASIYTDLNMVMTVAPNAVTIHADKLPENAPVRSQKEDLRAIQKQLVGVNFVDVTSALMSHKDEYLFYKTDHHWTSLAAGYAWQEIAPILNVTPMTMEDYTVYPVSTTFEGTLSSKSGSHSAEDTVEIYVPNTQIDYYVAYPDGGKEICSLYNREALDQKDHYTVFFGGNYSRLDISTTANTGKNLLMFKDSYANCLIQFLYPHFDHITMIDPRYYYDNVDLVIKSEGITDVLFLYNLDTFHTDTSLADVLTIQEN